MTSTLKSLLYSAGFAGTTALVWLLQYWEVIR